jgi:hypothetical protein
MDVPDKRHRQERERGGGVDHQRVRQDPDASGPRRASDQDVDRNRYRPDEGQGVAKGGRRPHGVVARDNHRARQGGEDTYERERRGALTEDYVGEDRHEHRLRRD